MKKYFCDVCGLELDIKLRLEPKPNNTAAAVCGLENLCPRCCRLAHSLPVAELVLAELRRMAAKDEVSLAPLPAPPLEPTGRGAKEKRAVLGAIERFRQEHGPGAISELADMAGVYEDEIRDMIICQKVPMASWRAVGKALGVSESDTGEKNRPISGAAGHPG